MAAYMRGDYIRMQTRGNNLPFDSGGNDSPSNEYFQQYQVGSDESPMKDKNSCRDDSFEAIDENEFLIQSPNSPIHMKKNPSSIDYICCLCNCIQFVINSMLNKMFHLCKKQPEWKSRTVSVGRSSNEKFPPNVVKNQKYNTFTFIPLVLFNQFKFFLNLYFLIMAISQFVPSLRVGYITTYWGPLIFVLLVTMIREAVDDFRRFMRDREMNSCKYRKLTSNGVVHIPSSAIKVSDLIIIDKNERVPADMVLLRTSEKNGSCFIRTDQLDGETDWKLRLSIESCQRLPNAEALFEMDASIYVEAPQKDIHKFFGTYTRHDGEGAEDALAVENTLWANTVVASGSAIGIVIYSGRETRSVMNNAQPRSKIGLLDIEVNQLTKILFFAVLGLSLVMVLLKGFSGPWPRYYFRFVLLFSYIIPISLIVNLDMGKIVYSWMIQRDKKISGTVVRTTTIPEELGRIVYLLSDKTGTLTQNEMIFKRLHLGSISYGMETFNEVSAHLKTAFAHPVNNSSTTPSHSKSTSRIRRTVVTRIQEAVKALSLCHNVTPVYDDDSLSSSEQSSPSSDVIELESIEADQHSHQDYSYQASSPDEVALVKWTESVGMALIKRDLTSMQIKTPHGAISSFTILQTFPFTSETKRMGIIVRDDVSDEITFYMKGADVVMSSIVQYNDWLEEECDNMARDGLRTLVVAKKSLTKEQYLEFEKQYNAAKLSKQDRSTKVSAVIETLERDLELLCVTGVEDKLQEGVRTTLELLRNAGIKIWMLTGDKLETATCIAKSSCLVSRTQSIHIFNNVTSRTEAHLELNSFRRKSDCALVITGSSLVVCLKYYEHEFMELACQCPAVICCRCSPTQKADVVKLIQVHTGKRTCAIGDGGNDVSMIQAADAGIGIVGKEGKQASLAADFSITQFSFISTLFLVHGRNSYKRSASLSQFIIHRGLIISTMQAVFSSVFYFASISLYQGFLMVGYATIYTNFPVFSLVLDKDVSSEIALMYPELYKELTKGRSLSFKTFFIWVAISIYQGGIIMYGALLLFEEEFIHIVAISFTSLIITELLMVALTIRTWHWLMFAAEVFSVAIYIGSLFVMKEYFDLVFMMSIDFFWKVIVITLVSCLPLYILKFLHKKFAPPSYSKLT